MLPFLHQNVQTQTQIRLEKGLLRADPKSTPRQKTLDSSHGQAGPRLGSARLLALNEHY
jgi:hypothetical protein